MSIDWVTLSVEASGIAIFCIWVVVPIGEFRSIYQRIKQRDKTPQDSSARPKGEEPPK